MAYIDVKVRGSQSDKTDNMMVPVSPRGCSAQDLNQLQSTLKPVALDETAILNGGIGGQDARMKDPVAVAAGGAPNTLTPYLWV